MHFRSMKTLVLSTALVFVCANADAGLTYRSESVTSGVKPHTLSGVAKIDGPNRRFEVLHNDGKLFATGSIILSSTKNHISTVLNPATKTYYVIDADKLQASVASTRKEISPYITMPEPQFTVKDDGPGGLIEGYPTERWLLTINTEIKMHATGNHSDTHMVTTGMTWTTDKVPAEAAAMFSDASFGRDNILDAFQRAHEKIHGFPLKAEMTTKMTIGGSTTTTMMRHNVTNIRSANFPASDFVIPPGYKQVPSPIDAMLARAGMQ